MRSLCRSISLGRLANVPFRTAVHCCVFCYGYGGTAIRFAAARQVFRLSLHLIVPTLAAAEAPHPLRLRCVFNVSSILDISSLSFSVAL